METCESYKREMVKLGQQFDVLHGKPIHFLADAVSEITVPIDPSTTDTDDKQTSKTSTEEGLDVFVRYGPYEACGIVDHRVHRLRGMQERLIKVGHRVHFQPIEDWNVVELWVHGEQVFNCDIRDLDFGSDGLLDGLCLEAVARVERAF